LVIAATATPGLPMVVTTLDQWHLAARSGTGQHLDRRCALRQPARQPTGAKGGRLAPRRWQPVAAGQAGTAGA
jgi:hypothetical protein